MGTFFTEVQLASPARPDRREIVKLLVDSGSVHTRVSAAVLRDLGVQATERRRRLTIEGRAIDRGAAEILLTLEGRTLHTLCVFGEPGDLEVLGAYTLEGFGLAVDPVSGGSSLRSSTVRRPAAVACWSDPTRRTDDFLWRKR